MRKFKTLSWLAGISFSLFLISVGRPGISQQNNLGYISEIKGKVEVKRHQHEKYQKAYVGDKVNSLDRLRLEKGASAKVMCNNLHIWNLKSPGLFDVDKGCPSTKQTGRPGEKHPPTF